jgi:hypothetical protein
MMKKVMMKKVMMKILTVAWFRSIIATYFLSFSGWPQSLRLSRILPDQPYR